jgi:hypothetical protein
MTSNFLPFDSSTSVGQTQQQLNDSIKTQIQNSEDINGAAMYQEDKSKFLGLDKSIFVFSTLIVLGSIGMFFYKRAKVNK